MGDPAGIGPDITLAAWRERVAAQLPPFFLIGDGDVLAERAQMLGERVTLREVRDPGEAADVFAHALPVLAQRVGVRVRAGVPQAAAAAATIAAIERGVGLIQSGEALALVTNPITKHVLYQAGFSHPGHTEFLAEIATRLWGEPLRAVMLLAAQELRVVPVTIHVPLREVVHELSEALIVETVEIAAQGLALDFGIGDPRIAVSALNPHAGEGGTLGDEEARIIRPAIERLKAKGVRVTGPLAADAMFHAAARRDYDLAVAMYHDQALIPIKTLAFDRAVNVTLGLPFVRTSPDHGTAYSLAGSGRVSPRSLIEAIRLAHDIAERRRLAT